VRLELLERRDGGEEGDVVGIEARQQHVGKQRFQPGRARGDPAQRLGRIALAFHIDQQ
jgi:hypothetical protein